jgi:hypothetical protein
MKPFHCDHCGSLVFFENVSCVNCGHALGFIPEALDLSALAPAENGLWHGLTPNSGNPLFRSCANGQQHAVCNWLVPADDANALCIACRLNLTIPDLSLAGNHDRWHRLEKAKRRLIYTFLRLGLPLDGTPIGNHPGLRFNFLGDPPGGPPVLTGHDAGLITVNILEADDPEREARRVSLHEPFRTLLGHFRHEASHYCWDRLVAGTPWIERFHQVFGDESADYSAALRRHYQEGPPADWQNRFVSAYASVHPWEDWAESCAHYFHIVDTLETAAGFGLSLHPRHPQAKVMTVDAPQAESNRASFDAVLGAWLPLTFALNSLNRGMGLPDHYPFVLSAPAVEKMRLVHEILAACSSGKM